MKKMKIKVLHELLENHNWSSNYSDDHQVWKSGKGAMGAIHKFIYLNGGWNREVLDTWNKFAPLSFKYDMKWVKQFFINKDSNYIKDMQRRYGRQV